MPLLHSAFAAHAPPLSFFTAHAPDAQKYPDMQWELSAHVVRHALVPHTYGSQSSVEIIGHDGPVPVQLAARVPTPLAHDAALHSTETGLNESFGHPLTMPLQTSATSQMSAAPRHTVPAGCLASFGHEVELPVHSSARSHSPSDARHGVPCAAGVV